MAQIEQFLADHRLHPARLTVLVPYAQLMEPARRAWAERHPSAVSPRFETTRNWASGLQPFDPAPTDLSMDTARDTLMASSMLERWVLRDEAALRRELTERLVDAARQLAPVAAAQPPADRTQWAQGLEDEVVGPWANLRWEALIARLALTWAANSSYPTDVLWGELAAPGEVADGLVVLQGYQPDLLAQALARRWGEAACTLDLPGEPENAATAWGFHPTSDAEDEGQRAAACVVTHLAAGRVPVALVANDRLLTRRIAAWLEGAGVAVRDETGWKLSTTQAAARVVGLLRAADPRASADDVIDWLKHSPAYEPAAVSALETQARRAGLAQWRQVQTGLAEHLPDGVVAVLSSLSASRPLPAWLKDVGAALTACGQWAELEADAAGRQLVQALRLGEAGIELASLEGWGDAERRAARRWSLAMFTAWVRDVLEGSSFQPPVSSQADVVVLPLAQLLCRQLGAVVVPGCDEVHLSPNPEPTGQWTPAQRQALGLPDREALAQALRRAWAWLLGEPVVDLLWRTSHRGEVASPSPWVLALQAQATRDPRAVRGLTAAPASLHAPTAAALVPDTLSASAYQDLRTCPYKFFALRMLRLGEADELDAELDQRDLGNWLHDVLRQFHEGRDAAVATPDSDRERLDALAQETARQRGLLAQADGAPFLPYLAVWPGLRDGYLDWLRRHEAGANGTVPVFEAAEVSKQVPLGPWRLRGQLDRIDVQDGPDGPIRIVMDYKTESRQTTRDRVANPLEDTQLAFYAALMPDERLRAGYLSITDQRSDREPATHLFELPDVIEARERLLDAIRHDLDRLASGAELPALGEGRACEHCAARGLCRKDFRA
jgi:ATP-dependent helicase/nuclease subunit B